MQALSLRSITLALALGVGTLSLAFTSSIAPVQAATPLVDAKGNPLPKTASERVISVGGSLTEIVYALGREEQLVAIDTTSVFPKKALKNKPNVGYMRALSAEGILAMNPSMILAEEGAGPKETIDLLQSASIPFVSVPSNYSEAGILAKIKTVGMAIGAEAEAAKLQEQVSGELAMVRKAVANVKSAKKKVLFLFSTRGDRMMVSGTKTQADAIIKMAGGVNVIEGLEGFKPVSNEAVLAANPDIVLMMSRAGMDVPSAEEVFKHPGLSTTNAAKNKALSIMPGMYLLGFGPRTASAVAELAQTLYPDIDLPKMDKAQK